MILTCTSCATRYYADDAVIGAAGRSVRCAACGHTWFAEPTVEGGDAPSAAALTRDTVERARRASASTGAPTAAARFRAQQAERLRRERARAAVMAWGATGATVAAAATGAVVFREDVVHTFPKSASAFAALGLEVNLYGLDVKDLHVEPVYEGATPVLLVSGVVHNIGGEVKAPPPLRLSVRGDHDQELMSWVHAFDASQMIPAGGSTTFLARIVDAPPGAAVLEASIADYAQAANANSVEGSQALARAGGSPQAPQAMPVALDLGEDAVVPDDWESGHESAAPEPQLHSRAPMASGSPG